MYYPVLFQIALVFVLVLVLVLSVAVLKWRANAELFETYWKESDRERANLEVRIADTENERLNLATDLSDLQAAMRLRELEIRELLELENDRLPGETKKLINHNANLKKELALLREFACAPVTERLQRIIDYSHQYDASTRKEIRGLAAKLMRV